MPTIRRQEANLAQKLRTGLQAQIPTVIAAFARLREGKSQSACANVTVAENFLYALQVRTG